MTLQHTDRSKGQVTEGKQKRSPEIFIPIKARRLMPSFWGWPDKYQADPKSKAKRDRPITIRMDGANHDARLMFWPEKDDLRFRSEAVRSAINSDDDLLLMMLSEEDGISYEVLVIHKEDEAYEKLFGCCVIQVDSKKSKKQFGYINDEFQPFNPPRDFWLLVMHRPEGPRYSLFTGKEKSRATDELRSLERFQSPAELVHLVEQLD